MTTSPEGTLDHTMERFRRVNFGRMHLDVTIEDPNVFTSPAK